MGAAPRCEGPGMRGVLRGVSATREAEQGYEAQMDVGATSVPPPGRVLSEEKLPHTLDGRRQREKKGILCRV